MDDERDPFDKVLDDADALHEVAMENVPSDLRKVAGDVMDFLMREAKASPLMALAVAGTVGLFIASLASK